MLEQFVFHRCVAMAGEGRARQQEGGARGRALLGLAARGSRGAREPGRRKRAAALGW